MKKDYPELVLEEIEATTPEGQSLIMKHGILSSPGILINDEFFAMGGATESQLRERFDALNKETMKKNSVFVLILLFFTAAYLVPALTFANGGDQRIVEGEYYINLSRAPFTPRVGVKTSFLASFVDIQKNKLIGEDIIVNIRISKLGEAPKGNFIFEQNNIPVKGGVLDFPYTFSEAVLHEIFFDFVFASNPEKVYNAPDFLIDVQKPEIPRQSNVGVFVGTTIGIALGFIGGWLARRKYIKTT